ncbi:MAG: Na/Pi symporter [Sulfurimonas sp.]
MYDVVIALSGLGMFLFGMSYMELALKEFAGIKFKRWLKHSTQTKVKAITTGAFATAVLQSSSVVTLMTLSFVSVSLITLEGAIGLIFGANIGTTATAWLVAILGFKVKIELFALPMIGLGGIILIAAKNKKMIASAKILIGFGLLFMGLDILKTAIEGFALGIDLASYKNFPLIAFLMLGVVITALIQSSSAATAIILSALSSQILTFEMAAAMAIGTNIGTTATAILGAIGGVAYKKRVAAAHIFFNLFTGLIAFLLLDQLSYFIIEVLGFQTDLVTALALFHTIFNLLGVALLTPFIDRLASVLNKLFFVKKEVSTKYIHKVDPDVAEGALIAIRDEIVHLLQSSIKYSCLLINIKPSEVMKGEKTPYEIVAESNKEYDYDFEKRYKALKSVEFDSIKYLNKISELPLSEQQTSALDTLYMAVRESVYAARVLRDIKRNINRFSQSDDKTTHYYFNLMRENIVKAIRNALRYGEEGIDPQDILKEHEEIINENKSFLNKLTRNFEKETIEDKLVVAFLHSNRSVLLAISSFIDAAKVLGVVFEMEEEEEEVEVEGV